MRREREQEDVAECTTCRESRLSMALVGHELQVSREADEMSHSSETEPETFDCAAG
jgi:hypothetical protein